MNHADRQKMEAALAWQNLPTSVKKAMATKGITGPLDDSLSATQYNNYDQISGLPAPTSAPAPEDPADELRDLIPGLTADQATAILAWHTQTIDAAFKAEISTLLYCIVLFLIRPNINHTLATWGLVYAAGLEGAVVLGRNQKQQAESLGEDRAKLNHYVTQWRDRLGFTVLKFCRPDSARAAYAARASKTHATPKTSPYNQK
jgi:hypothetical protein